MRFLTCVFFLLPALSHAQAPWSLQTGLNYIGDATFYTTPDRQEGIAYMGWLLNTTELSYTPRHTIHLDFMLTHGGEPSRLKIGDLQTFSNIEAGFLYGFYEAYYQCQGKRWLFKIGQQDLNTDFMVSENGLLFTHSSLGIDPVTTLNIPAPTYPFVALALTSSFTLDTNFTLRAGIFDGRFTPARNHFLPIDWSLGEEEGFLWLIEPQFQTVNRYTSIKLGAYYYSGSYVSPGPEPSRQPYGVVYLISDIQLSRNTRRNLHLFTQFSLPFLAAGNPLQWYAGGGFRWNAPFSWSWSHELGLGIAHASLNMDYRTLREAYALHSETAFELTLKGELTSWLSIQPYLQYIVQDDLGAEKPEPFIVALRIQLAF